MRAKAKSIDAPEYRVSPDNEYGESPKDARAHDYVIERARQILRSRMNTATVFNSPQLVKDFLQMEAVKYSDREVFSVLFLDAQHRMVEFVEMFRGTLTQTSVYPREVAKEALRLNAAAVILTHNHPSGCLEPSKADEMLTSTLKSALALIDVRVLDHIITSHEGTCSFAEKGRI